MAPMAARECPIPVPNRLRKRAVRAKLLVLAADPVVAALLGLLAEAADCTPAFAAEGERAEDAIERVRPLYVVLIDGAMQAADSDLFYARAARSRVALAVFTTSTHASFPQGALRRGVPCAPVPMDLSQLEALLEAASASRWWERTERRAVPVVEQGADGSLVLVDAQGRRWRVLDRRGADRRRSSAGAVERLFVGDDGETRALTIDGDAVSPRSATELARQLALARTERNESPND
jgi:hypothetical protein